MDTKATEELAIEQYDLGVAAFRRGDNAECRRLSEAALSLGAVAGSDRAQAMAHIGLSRADFRDAAYTAGVEHARAAERYARACGADDVRVKGLHMRAELTRAEGDYEAAVPLYEELLAADEASGDLGSLSMEHYNLASVLIQTGALSDAGEHLRTSLSLCAHSEGQLPYTLLGCAGLLARTGDAEAAGRVLGAVETHFESVGQVLDPAEGLELATHVQAGRRRDAAGFDAGRSAGRSCTLDEAQVIVAGAGL